MRIKKLFIKNFKNIEKKTVIDFESSTTFLTGPNGFGKTSIFDALELVITGKIYRANEKDVTNDNRDYTKPYFQNNDSEDVIIKVWLEDSEKQNFIIVKHFDIEKSKQKNKGRKFKPGDFSYLFTYQGNINNFDSEEIGDLPEITDQKIADFFGFQNKKANLDNIYKLFNYLQQEETTFFLKKSENERKDQFTHLFQINEEESYLKKIIKIRRKLQDSHVKIQEKLASNVLRTELSSTEYSKIFSNREDGFDNEFPFSDINVQNMKEIRDNYKKTVSQLIEFKKRFKPEEYYKKKKTEQFRKIIHNDSFIKYLILREYLEEKTYKKIELQHDILIDNTIIKKYIFQKHILNYDKYIKKQKEYNEIKEAFSILSTELEFTSKLKELLLKIYGKSEDQKEINFIFEEFDKNAELQGTINKTLDNVLSLRRELKEQVKHLPNEHTQCPYCGENYKSNEHLHIHFQKRENELTALGDYQISKLNNIRTELKEKYIEPAVKELPDKLKKMPQYDEEILKELEYITNSNISLKEYEQYLRPYEDKVIDDLTELRKEELEQLIKNITKDMEEKSIVSKEIYQLLMELTSKNFEEYLGFINNELEDKKEEINLLLENKNKQMNNNLLSENMRELKKVMNTWTEKFKYEAATSSDKRNFFSIYFDEDKEKFESINSKKLAEKKNYIEYRYSIKNNHLYKKNLKKKKTLSLMIDKLDKIISIYSDSIQRFKSEMINQIKIPFYIYTAKILQNYQQGLGIFLSTKHGTGDSIRFITDNTSDHDAMHHLSSGQLSVISLAFTLAINKTYKISDELDFLLIDDPIEDMDVMNMYTTTELLRHEFLEKYQIILSTHNALNANFMNFKFNKIPGHTIKLVDVQNELYFNS